MSYRTCSNCGSKLYGGLCPYCHEEVLIEEQYIEEGMIIPKNIEEKAQKHREEARLCKKDKEYKINSEVYNERN